VFAVSAARYRMDELGRAQATIALKRLDQLLAGGLCDFHARGQFAAEGSDSDTPKPGSERAVLPARSPLAREADVGLVHQRRGFECVTRPLALQVRWASLRSSS
jgi:hypothetical protein